MRSLVLDFHCPAPCWGQAASPEIANYWAGFATASKDFQGGLIFPRGRGAARLSCCGISPLDCLRR